MKEQPTPIKPAIPSSLRFDGHDKKPSPTADEYICPKCKSHNVTYHYHLEYFTCKSCGKEWQRERKADHA